MADPESQKGGPGVHIQSSLSALKSLGHTVQMTGPRLDPTSSPVTAVPRRRSIWRRGLARYGYQPRALARGLLGVRTVAREVNRFDPDVVVARYEAFDLMPLGVARSLDVPLIWEVNGTSAEIPRWNPSLFLYPGTRALERATLNAAAAVFVVSTELREQLHRDGIDAGRIAVIPNGADPARVVPRDRAEQLGGLLPADAVIVGFLGSFSRWHDVHTMATVMAQVARRRPHVRFVLAGAAFADLPEAAQAALAPIQDRIVLPGVVPIAHAPRWMSRFDVALSLYPQLEGFYFSPVKLFEYMAAGCAVVATATGQQARVIQHGSNGVLVPPDDITAATDAVTALVDAPDLRVRLGRAARDTVMRGYTWQHNAARIVELCERAIASRRDGGRVGHLGYLASEPAL